MPFDCKITGAMVEEGSLRGRLRALVRTWELEAQALENVQFENRSPAAENALREAASAYRKCAADLLDLLKSRI